jgi:XTP/dITP diphosphohydrolase
MSVIRVATRNRHKLRELRELLSPINWEVIGLDDLPDLQLVEDADSFAENARAKATAVHRITGGHVLADDSGLMVDVLNGLPGVRSARYASAVAAGCDQDAANRQKLLAALANVSPAQRTAHFVCALVWIDPQARYVSCSGELHGRIIDRERGAGGFGYDSLFVPVGLHQTLAELSADEKNAISHRSRALAQLVVHLRA